MTKDERIAKATAWSAGGVTEKVMAERLGVTVRTIRRYVREGRERGVGAPVSDDEGTTPDLTAVVRRDVEVVRAEKIQRLEALRDRLMPFAMGEGKNPPSWRHVDRVLRLEQELAKLYGLYAIDPFDEAEEEESPLERLRQKLGLLGARRDDASKIDG